MVRRARLLHACRSVSLLRAVEFRERKLKRVGASHDEAVQIEGSEQLTARIAREVPMWKKPVEYAGIRIN